MKSPENRGSTTEGVGVSPSLGPVMEYEQMAAHATLFGREVWRLAGLAIFIGAVAAMAAIALLRLIGLLTNLCFYGRFSFSFADPTSAHLGVWIIAVPIAGAIVVGFMARFGHAGIRGHGIPEAMETILTNQSRIPKRITLLTSFCRHQHRYRRSIRCRGAHYCNRWGLWIVDGADSAYHIR
ncbi:MAG: hypothetical protein ACP5QA_09710 [Phycisphaerae bacterium]